jgi:hypothetical protein
MPYHSLLKVRADCDDTIENGGGCHLNSFAIMMHDGRREHARLSHVSLNSTWKALQNNNIVIKTSTSDPSYRKQRTSTIFYCEPVTAAQIAHSPCMR